jgi:hypothetical protein
VRAFFLADGNDFYCGDCGWNIDKATKNLRIAMWASWVVSIAGIVLAAFTVKGPWGIEGVLLVAVPFVLLPFASGLVTRYRLSKIPVRHVGAKTPPTASVAAATRDCATSQNDALFAARPRAIRFTKRGYIYSFGVALATVFVLWVMSISLRELVGASGANKTKSVFIVVLWSVFLWFCASFCRNRVREGRLFIHGELSRGTIVSQFNTELGSRIVYSFKDGNEKVFQNRATDFSKRLYEEMPIHVFYNPLDSRDNAVLEGSLFQLR